MANVLVRANSWLADESGSFERTLRTRPSRGALLVAAAASVLAFFALLPAVPHGLPPGDAAWYADQILHVDLAQRTVHIGYYLLGIAFTRLVPVDVDYALNLMSAVFGGLSVGVVALLAYTLTGRLSASIAGACTLVGFAPFIQNAVWAEVYGPQLFFFLLCILLTLWDAPALSGLSFAAAFLIAPSTVLTLPLIALLRPHKRFLAWFSGAAAIPLIVVLAPHYQDFLWGGRGLILVSRARLHVLAALSKEAREAWSFYLALPFIAVGLYTLASSGRHKLLLAGLFIVWALHLVFGEGIADFAVQLPVYGILCVISGVGFARVLQVARTVAPLRVAAYTLLVGSLVVAGVYNYSEPYRQEALYDGFRQTVLAIPTHASPNDLVLTPYSITNLVDHYLRAAPLDSVTYESLSGGADPAANAQAQERFSQAVGKGQRVWLPGRAVTPTMRAFFSSVGYTITPVAGVAVATPSPQ